MTIIVSGQAAGAGHWSYKQLSTFPVIKNLAHLARKRLRREGLLEKRHAWVQLPVMEHSLVGVARHKEDLHVGTQGLQPFRQLRSEEHTSELQSRGHLVCRLLL